MELKIATPKDAQAILDIYAGYVEKTCITFESHSPTLEDMRHRITTTLEEYPYIVVYDHDRLCGYAYASRYRIRQAYDWHCELSIYVQSDAKGQGYGKKLYQCLLDILAKMRIQVAYACITYPNKMSEDFHYSLGFEAIGIFKACGYKHDQWHDTIWLEKVIGDRCDVQAVIPFSQLPPEEVEGCLK